MIFRTLFLIPLLTGPNLAQKPQSRPARSLRLPKGYSIPPITRSPDGRYGVLIPDINHYDWHKEQNKLIDLRTGRTLAVIHAFPTALHKSHGQIDAGNWSRDRSLFLWRVEGKWSPTALVLLKIRNGRVLWQLNILRAAQKATLIRTKRASPRRYRAAMRENKGNGAAYPDGFTVDVTVNVEPGKTLTLPLNVTASLTANPKELEGYPKEAELKSELSGIVTKAGKFKVTGFALAPVP